MRERIPDRETYLEIGLVIFGGVVLGGIAIWLVGQSVNEVGRMLRHAKPPPSTGSIPPERHQNISAVSTR